jgi:hypothetical protein
VQLGQFAPTTQPTEHTVVCNVCGHFINKRADRNCVSFNTTDILKHVNSDGHTKAKAAADQNVDWQPVAPRGIIDYEALVRWFATNVSPLPP